MEKERQTRLDEVVYESRVGVSEKVAAQRFSLYNIMLRQKEGNLTPLTDEQKSEIGNYWKKRAMWHKELVNMGYYEVYNTVEKDKSKLKYYIPDSFFYAFVDEYFTNPQRSTALDDKNLYDLLFYDVKRPKTIARKMNDLFMYPDFSPCGLDDFLRAVDGKEVVVKSAICSYGGHGVMFWDSSKDKVEKLMDFIYAPNTRYYRGSNVYSQYIVQEVIKQHSGLALINPHSVNTIRVMTLCRNGEINALSAVLRMGVNGSRVDNCSSGGIVCGITEYGKLKGVAYDGSANRYTAHPQGGSFEGRTVPSFAKVVNKAKELAARFYGASRLISWDFAVGEDGEPVLIEMNISYGELDFHQLCNGPIFGDETDDILDEVFSRNVTLSSIVRDN